MSPIVTRVGHIGDHDNRFLGRSVFDQLVGDVRSHSDTLALALGVSPDDDDREALRLVAICTTSPDARVWPLKLCRLLASFGDPVVGYFGAQLVSAGKVMGPGTVAACAATLRFVAELVGDDAHYDAVGAAIDRWRAERGRRVAGFGVPFRPEDERLVAMRRFVRGTALAERPYWRLQEQVVAVMANRIPEQPNVALGVTALLLDVGVAPHHCGLALSLSMAHVFAAHAMEAAVTDGAGLHDLPREAVDYRGVPPRSTTSAGPPVPAGLAIGRQESAEPTAYARAGGAQ